MTTISMPAPPAAVGIVYLRPQSLSEILSGALHLMRGHFWRLVGVFLVATIPARLMTIYGQETHSIELVLAGLFLLLAAIIFVQPMLTVMVGDICRGMRPSLKRAISLTFRRLPVIFVNSLLVLLIFAAGFIFFVVPGVIALVQLMFVAPVSTLEEKRWGVAAIRRSRQLGLGYHWRSFRLLLLMSVLGFALGLVSLPVRLLVQAIPGAAWIDPLVENFVQGVAQIFGLISSVLLYYELRARKEGLTPDVLMQDLRAGF
ncbi:MAG TPA: hypothetical protein VJ276_08425 [Thermoanaerobaculia bacterium]|nr:hypothetical protein [Thermoanaerobaculia bacterium]